CLHHFVSHPPKEEGIGLVEVLDRVTMQLFVRGNCTMIAAPVQSDVDGIPKGSHYVLLKRANAALSCEPSARSPCEARQLQTRSSAARIIRSNHLSCQLKLK